MKYNIVAGEELKKIMSGVLDNPIPFNEDMSIGSYSSKPFTEEFINERSGVHKVSASLYKEKLKAFLELAKDIKYEDEIHLYFGGDIVCNANREFLIEYFKTRVKSIFFHLVNEYEGIELSITRVK